MTRLGAEFGEAKAAVPPPQFVYRRGLGLHGAFNNVNGCRHKHAQVRPLHQTRSSQRLVELSTLWFCLNAAENGHEVQREVQRREKAKVRLACCVGKGCQVLVLVKDAKTHFAKGAKFVYALPCEEAVMLHIMHQILSSPHSNTSSDSLRNPTPSAIALVYPNVWQRC